MRVGGMWPIAALVGVLAMILVAILPQSAAAQAGSKQIISGQTVSWSAEWTEDTSLGLQDDGIELLALTSGTSVVGYGGTTFAVPGNELRGVLLEGLGSDSELEQVDRGDYDNVSYSIDISNREGVPLAVFTLVIERPNSTTMALLIDAPDRFEAAITAAQAGVTVDGTPVFDGVDAAEMQRVISAFQGADAGGSTEQAAPTASAGGLGDLGAAINADATTPAATTPQTPAPADSIPVPPNAVTITSSGVELRYTDDWTIQSQDASSVSLGTVAQPVVLVTVIDLGAIPDAMDAASLAAGLQQEVSSLADAEVVTAIDPSPGRMVIVFRDPDENGMLYRVYDVAIDPVATTAVTVITAEASLQPAVELLSGTVQVNGQPVLADLHELAPATFGGR